MVDNSEIDKLPHSIITEDVINHDVLYKLIMVGDAGVGKSCLMLRGTRDEFKENYEMTLSVEFGSLALKIDNMIVKVQIWDTAGQETFQSVAKVFYKGAQCIFLVYDITREETFMRLHSWIKEIRDNTSPNTMFILVGNMLDLEKKRVISCERALEFKSKENLDGFIETSAKIGTNVQSLLIRSAKTLFTRDTEKKTGKQKAGGIIRINPASSGKVKSGCSC